MKSYLTDFFFKSKIFFDLLTNTLSCGCKIPQDVFFGVFTIELIRIIFNSYNRNWLTNRKMYFYDKDVSYRIY